MTENKFKEFQETYKGFKDIVRAVQETGEGKRGQAVRKIAADLFTAPVAEDYKNYLLNNRNIEPDELHFVLAVGMGQKDARLINLESNLESLISGMEDLDVNIGLQIMPPKDSYSGSNAEVYQKITDLSKKAKEMDDALNAKDGNKMYAEVKASEDVRLSSVDTDQKALCDALINAKGNFIIGMYAKNYQTIQKDFITALQGNEKGYLIANLKETNFRDFYDVLEDTKKNPRRRTNERQR